jgi:hypothetical protein
MESLVGMLFQFRGSLRQASTRSLATISRFCRPCRLTRSQARERVSERLETDIVSDLADAMIAVKQECLGFLDSYPIRHWLSKAYCHSGSLKHRPMIST